jgi:hypothetical protein
LHHRVPLFIGFRRHPNNRTFRQRHAGRLSDREFEIMKTHTTIGAQTLDAALGEFPDVEFLKMGRATLPPRTMNDSTAKAIPANWSEKKFPSAAASSPWPMCTTRSLPAAFTNPPSPMTWPAR